jgi:hypothetical protein
MGKKLTATIMGCVASSLIILVLATMTAITYAAPANEPHNADAMWVEPSSVTFDGTNASVGQKFNVTVWLNMTENVFNWQVGLHYNRTQLKCLRALPTAGTSSEYMSGAPGGSTFLKAIDTSFLGNGSILASEACFSPDFIAGPNNGSLFWAEFNVTSLPASGSLTSSINISKEYLPNGAGNTWVHDQPAPAGTDTYWDISTFDAAYTIVPEFSYLILPIFLAATIIAVVFSKRVSQRQIKKV